MPITCYKFCFLQNLGYGLYNNKKQIGIQYKILKLNKISRFQKDYEENFYDLLKNLHQLHFYYHFFLLLHYFLPPGYLHIVLQVSFTTLNNQSLEKSFISLDNRDLLPYYNSAIYIPKAMSHLGYIPKLVLYFNNRD